MLQSSAHSSPRVLNFSIVRSRAPNLQAMLFVNIFHTKKSGLLFNVQEEPFEYNPSVGAELCSAHSSICAAAVVFCVRRSSRRLGIHTDRSRVPDMIRSTESVRAASCRSSSRFHRNRHRSLQACQQV